MSLCLFFICSLNLLLSVLCHTGLSVGEEHLDEETEPVDLEKLEYGEVEAIECDEYIVFREFVRIAHDWIEEDVDNPER